MSERAEKTQADFVRAAEGYANLGPSYFAAQDVAEKFMAQFSAEQFEPLLRKAADDFYERLNSALHDYLISNVESNIQTTLWYQIDESVKALLSGQEWALKKYVLGERYEHDKIREAVARVVPRKLQDARIKDLEVEVKRLRESLQAYQNRY